MKRSEGPFFQSLYQLHKLITFIFTGKKINFGNYSILTRNDVEKLYSKASLWSSFSGSVKKNIKSLNEIKEVLTGMSLYLGMEIPNWPPDNIAEMSKKLEEAI